MKRVYIVTNRCLNPSKKGYDILGDRPNEKGGRELRVLYADRDDNENVSLTLLPDTKKAGKYPSERSFLEMQKKMRDEERNCVFFVHGYNVNIESAVRDAFRIRDLYQVEVILFTWPANGGGNEANRPKTAIDFLQAKASDIHGLASYLSDKRDAEQSKGALDRCFQILDSYFTKYAFDKKSGRVCDRKITLICHSMGGFLLKKLCETSTSFTHKLVFDNVVLCATDTNNSGHEKWVAHLAHRRRIYITLNENDFALRASRLKLGDRQKARLGHYTKNLISPIASYLDFTEAIGVGNSHGYFVDESVENKNVYDVFNHILNGERCEPLLTFNSVEGFYSVV